MPTKKELLFYSLTDKETNEFTHISKDMDYLDLFNQGISSPILIKILKKIDTPADIEKEINTVISFSEEDYSNSNFYYALFNNLTKDFEEALVFKNFLQIQMAFPDFDKNENYIDCFFVKIEIRATA